MFPPRERCHGITKYITKNIVELFIPFVKIIAMSKAKPVVAYLHRYPPEIEAVQWPALWNLAESLKKHYDMVYLCMGPATDHRDEGLRKLMRVIELPFSVDQSRGRDKWFKTLRWYQNLRHTLSRMDAMNPVAILCKETLPLIPGRVVALGTPTIISSSDWWWSILLGRLPGGLALAQRLERYEVRRWNRPHVRATVSTQAEGRLLEAKGMDKARIVVINPPLNPEVFRPLTPPPSRAELGLDERLKYFAICGIIRGGKGYEQLLDWWGAVVKAHPDWRFVIIGGAGGENWCRRQISRRGLHGTVHMTGWLPTKQDVNRWLNVMDAVLVHRRNSPDNQGIIPSALNNGLATGRPVVACGLPGIAEIVRDGVDGFLFTPDDQTSFIATLERVIADPSTAACAGKAGIARATECFNPQHSAQAHLALIDEIR